MPYERTRWSRFAGVGVMGFLAQIITLQALTSLHVPYLVAVILAVEAAILHNFIWHERWTWRDRVGRSTPEERFARLAWFNATTGLVSLAGNALLTAFFVSIAGLRLIVANVAAILALTVLNFIISDRTFRSSGVPGFLGFGVLKFRRSFAPELRGSGVSRGHGSQRRATVVAAALCFVFAAGPVIHAATLTPGTVAAWERYVAGAEARLTRQAQDTKGFLSMDRLGAAEGARLRSEVVKGEIFVDAVGGGTIDIGDGTISHWRGYVFVPGVTVSDLLEGARLAGRGGRVRQEDVLDARVLGVEGDALRLFLKLQRRAIVTVAYNTEHLVTFERYGSDRAASRSISTRIAELRDTGTPHEREEPVGQDRGFLWRLHSYWRYQAIPGGVVVELESLTLSRSIPWALRAMASPIVNRIARESMTRTLGSLRSRWAGRA